MNRIPNVYRGPMGLPLYWRNEASGVLTEAVTAYLDNRVDGKPISEAQIGLVREFLVHYINAPCWYQNPHLIGDPETLAILDGLVHDAAELKTPDDIQAWIHRGLGIGLDPL